MHPSVELPPIQNHINSQPIPPFHSPRPRELLPSMLAHSPPERSTTLPPLQREGSLKRDKPARPRKSSITQNSRKPKHEKSRSKDQSRRLSIEGRKAFSAEPPGAIAAAARGKRWEDLIEAATSATEADSDRDLTPVCDPSTVLQFASAAYSLRSLNLQHPSNAPQCHPTRPFLTINHTKLHPSKTPSRRLPHTPSQDPHLFPPSKLPSTHSQRNPRWAAGTTSISPPPACQTALTQSHLPSTQAVIPCKYTARGVGGRMHYVKATHAQSVSRVSAATVYID